MKTLWGIYNGAESQKRIWKIERNPAYVAGECDRLELNNIPV